MVQVHLGPPITRALEALMKKLLLLAAAIGAAVFAANKKNQQQANKPADPWAQASDRV